MTHGYLIFKFIFDCISVLRGSPMMDLELNARGLELHSPVEMTNYLSLAYIRRNKMRKFVLTENLLIDAVFLDEIISIRVFS